MPSPAAPQHHPTPRELDDLELLTIGALAPISRFNEPGSQVTLQLPTELTEAGAVELVDPEGLPLAVVRTDTEDGWEVESLTHAQYGPFRRLYLTPAEARERYAGRTFVPVTDALTDTQLAELERPRPGHPARAGGRRHARAPGGRPAAGDADGGRDAARRRGGRRTAGGAR